MHGMEWGASHLDVWCLEEFQHLAFDYLNPIVLLADSAFGVQLLFHLPEHLIPPSIPIGRTETFLHSGGSEKGDQLIKVKLF